MIENTQRDELVAACEDPIRGLSYLYSAYSAQEGEFAKKRSVSPFAKWMQVPGTELEPEHKNFLDGVERYVSELCQIFSALCELDREACEDLCKNALDVIFVKKPKKETTDTQRFLAISEYHSPGLFAFASSDNLKQIHRELLERTPKRLMFPKHKELVNLLEKTISDKS